ncbi:MAG: DNA polymerase Y family protein [Hyphomicrobiales bacterium]
MDRAIIHVNVADFAVAVERAIDRRLAGRPVVIAPEGAARAAVYDMSEEAYRAGVRKGMLLGRAARLCRSARILPPRPERYEQAMRALLEQALPYSPLIEAGEVDGHLFIDATGTGRLFGPPMDIAWRLRRQVRAHLGLAPVWSVAANKLVAKVATRLVKPDGEYFVAAGEEEPFLAPLPLALLPGIEREDLLRLREFNLTRAGEVTALRLEELRVRFGNRAMLLYEVVRGIDPSPVLAVGEKPPKVTTEQVFGTDTNDAEALQAALYRLAEQAGAELRRRRRAAQRVAVLLDYSDGAHCARQAAARPATANDIALFEIAGRAYARAWVRRLRVRRLRLICDRLVFPPAQLELFPAERRRLDQRDQLIPALDAVRRRFGGNALQVGRTLTA